MSNRVLDVITVVSNPMGWDSRIKLADEAIQSWLTEPNVRVTLVESAHGARAHSLSKYKDHPRVNYVPVRSTTLVWNKESMMNYGISRLPHDAQYIVTADADVKWRKNGWAVETMNALDLYPVVQPWSVVHDLGPKNELLATFKSFACQYHGGHQVIPSFDKKTLQLTNSPYDYPHPGFIWAWTRKFLDMIGGLFDWGGVGAGDHHMALGLIGEARMSMPPDTHPNYQHAVLTWQARACAHSNKKIGFVNWIIDHPFHGRKEDRAYNQRWAMFLKHQFDPYADLKRNTYGILEFAGNKPELELEWDRYMRSRQEDVNTLK